MNKDKMENKDYRTGYNDAMTISGIAYQVMYNRTNRGLSQEALAEEAGIPLEVIKSIENFNADKVSLMHLTKICKALDIALFARLTSDIPKLEPSDFSIPSFEDDKDKIVFDNDKVYYSENDIVQMRNVEIPNELKVFVRMGDVDQLLNLILSPTSIESNHSELNEVAKRALEIMSSDGSVKEYNPIVNIVSFYYKKLWAYTSISKKVTDETQEVQEEKENSSS